VLLQAQDFLDFQGIDTLVKELSREDESQGITKEMKHLPRKSRNQGKLGV